MFNNFGLTRFSQKLMGLAVFLWFHQPRWGDLRGVLPPLTTKDVPNGLETRARHRLQWITGFLVLVLSKSVQESLR